MTAIMLVGILTGGQFVLGQNVRLEVKAQALTKKPVAAPANPPRKDPGATTLPAESLPPRLREFAVLQEQCAAYREATSGVGWKTIVDEQFNKSAKPSWDVKLMGEGKPKDNSATLQKDGERDVLLLDASDQDAMLAVGPAVKGDFSIEFTGKMTTAGGCDLSIFTGLPGEGPGFQFGGQNNQVNSIWSGPNAQAGGRFAQVTISNQPRIEKDKWYKVRLEVRDGQVRGYVDDQLIGQQPLQPGYDREAPRQPTIYTWRAVVALNWVKVSQLTSVAKKYDEKEAWTKGFGDTPREQVEKRITALVDMLGDDDEKVRIGAGELLKRLGELAIPPLEKAASEAMPEAAGRAETLLEWLKAPPVSAAPAPAVREPVLEQVITRER
ncbi:MAG TPA: hypothetical protein VIL86_04660 [Tepidisphaeraceae bacterium]